MMDPFLAFIIGFITAFVRLKTESRLVFIMISQSSLLIRSNKPSFVIPALLMRISTLPNSAITSSTSFCAASKSDASLWKPFIFVVELRDFSSSAAFSTEPAKVNATCAPCFAKLSTIPLPIPREPPVINATFPSNNPIFYLLNHVVDDEDNLPFQCFCFRKLNEFLYSTALGFFKFLGYFAAQARFSSFAEELPNLLQCGIDLMRTFVQNYGFFLFCQLFQLRLPAFLLWQKTCEQEFVVGQSRNNQCRYKGCSSGQALHFQIRFRSGTSQEISRIRNARCTGICNDCDIHTVLQVINHLLGGVMFIMKMIRFQRFGNLIML